MTIQGTNINIEYEHWWINFKTQDRCFVYDFDNILPFDTRPRKDRTEEELKEICKIANTKSIKPDNRMHNLKWYLFSFC